MSQIMPITSAISNITTGGATGAAAKVLPQSDPLGSAFGGILNEIAALNNEAGALQKAMYAGQPVELHQVMIAGEKAGIAFELLVEARNRLVEAYQELMRMPV